MASALDPYTPAEKAQQSGVPSIPGLDSLSMSPELAAHQMNQQSYQSEQVRAQQQATELQKQQETRQAANEAAARAADPNTQKPWYALTADQQKAATAGHTPLVIPDIPGLHNQAVTTATGRPTGANVQDGEQASGEAAGIKFQNLQPNAQQDAVDPATGQPLVNGRERVIQGIINKQVDLNTIPARGPQRLAILQQVLQRDPNFNEQNYPAQMEAKKSFLPSGKNGQNITSANTGLKHLSEASDAIDAMNNSSIPGWNAAANSVGALWGTNAHSAVTAYQTSADIAATELAKFFSGGIPNEGEIKRFQTLLSPNEKPQALKGNLSMIANMVGARLGELNSQWQKSVGKNRDIPFLDEGGRQALSKLGVNPDTIEPVGAQQAPTVQSTPTPTAQPAQVQKPQLSAQDQAAIQWAQQNPTDPRAARIKQLHGIK